MGMGKREDHGGAKSIGSKGRFLCEQKVSSGNSKNDQGLMMGMGKREETNSIGSKGASVYALYEKTPIIILEVEVINTFEKLSLKCQVDT